MRDYRLFWYFDSQGLRKGIRLMAHRGPDDWGMFVDEEAKVGLRHVGSPFLMYPRWPPANVSEDGRSIDFQRRNLQFP